jgi:hypothetical protein
MVLEVTTVNVATAPHATLPPVTPDLDIRKVGDGQFEGTARRYYYQVFVLYRVLFLVC